RLLISLDVDHSPAIRRKAQVPVEIRGSGNSFRFALHFPTLLVDSNSPKTHIAAAIAGEVKELTVRGPNRIPIRRSIFRHDFDLTAVPRKRREVASARTRRHEPERNAIPIRRPRRLHRVVLTQETLVA